MAEVRTTAWAVARTLQIVRGGYREGMVNETGTFHGQPEVARRQALLENWRANLFAELAQRAEDLARTIEFSAEVHAQMPVHLLTPRDHEKRGRELAAAERAAAEAYRTHRLPPDDVRAAIRQARDISTG
jgi:hypothetical protein